MNGASEATLQELLAVNQQMADSLARLAGSSGGGGGAGGGGAGGTAKQMNALGKAAQTAGNALGSFSGILGKALTPALSAATAGFNAVVKSGQVLYQNQIALAEGAIQGTNSLASLTAGLEQLPGILGLAMKAYNYEIKKKEAEVAIYQQISTTGARFGASLDEVRRSAASTYLSLDEFSKVMQEAGPQLRYLGSTTEEGAKNLVKFNSTMIKGEVGKGLLGMGYSLEQANSLLADYSATIGGLKADQLKDQKAMEKSVKFFAEELDAAAQLEGKTREQKLEELKKNNQNAAVRAKLAEMTDQQRLKFDQAMLKARSQGEKEYLQSVLLGMPPMTKAAQQFAALNSEGANALNDTIDAVNDNTKAEESRDRINQNANKVLLTQAQTYEKLGKAGQAAIIGNSSMADSAGAAAEAYAEIKNTGLDTEEKLNKRTQEVYNQQKKAQDSTIGDLVQMQGAAKHTGTFLDLLSQALKPLAPYILKLNDLFIKLVTAAAPIAAELIEKGIGVLSDIFSKVDWEVVKDSFGKAWGLLTNTFGSMYDSISKALGGGSGIGQFLQDTLVKLFEVLGNVAEAVGSVVRVFAESSLFQTLKEYFLKIVDIVTGIVEVVVDIVKSPFGTWLAGAIFSTIDLLMTPFKLLIDAISAAVDIVFGIVKLIQGDFQGGMDKIMDGIGTLVKSIVDFFFALPKYVYELLGGSWVDIGKAIHGFIDGMISAVKDFIGGVIDWFTGGKSKTGSTASAPSPAAPSTAGSSAAPASPNTPMTAEAQKRAAELGTPPAKTEAGQQASGTPTAVAPKSQSPQDILIAELQTLNKITAEMLRSLKDTADYTKSTANLIASNGNMFRRA